MSDRYSRRDLCTPVLSCDPDQPLRMALEEYRRSLIVRNYSVRTIELRIGHLAELLGWLSEHGVVRPDQVSRDALEGYQQWLHTAHLANGKTRAVSTQGQRLIAVRTFFRFLARTGRIPDNPAMHLELPRVEKPLPKPVLTRAEVELVLAQPDLTASSGIRDRAIMETLFATGIRRQELAWLQMGDVNHEGRTLAVQRGKGKRGRVVPISERALLWIDRYLAVRPAPASASEAGVLFLTSRGHMFGLIHLSRSIKGYIESAKINKKGSCHTFRATAATMMLEGGADIRFVQEMLGHAKITTTQLYTRVSIGALQRVYERTHPSAIS